MVVRRAGPADAALYAKLRLELWPDIPTEENTVEARTTLAGERPAIFIAETPRGEPVGFAEAALRAYAEGCSTSPVGYLEGWYVRPHARHRGVGRLLMETAENWAREQGCTEMGSDAESDNIASEEAHQKLGYTITCRLVTFRKPLT